MGSGTPASLLTGFGIERTAQPRRPMSAASEVGLSSFTSVSQDTSHRLQKSLQRRVAGVSKTDRSVDGRDANRLCTLEARKDGWSPHAFKLQSTESAVEGQH